MNPGNMKDQLKMVQQIKKAQKELKKELIIKKPEASKEELEHNFFDDENNEFSFDSDLTKDKPEPLKEFWD